MTAPARAPRIRPDLCDATSPFARDVIAGLSARPKRLPPKYFYDETGSELFEQITELDPKPLRQWNELVPQELDRICFKMLAKRK